jgi:glycine cleavage system H protein
MQIPETLRYSPEHEWVRDDGDVVTVGITDFAQDSLGDVVFVQLPEVGAVVTVSTAVSEIESTKSVSDIYAPVSGVVRTVNEDLHDAPQLVNQEPYLAGWIMTIEPSDRSELDGLLDAAGYRALVEG